MTGAGYSCDVRHVRATVKKRLTELSQQSALTVEELRAHENERLDDAIRKLYPLMEEGNLKAMTLFLKVSERRAKLNGLDVPTRVAIEATDALSALGIDRDLIERATAAFQSSFAGDEDIFDAEVVSEEEAPTQQGQEARLPRALEEGGGGRRQEEPPAEEALDAGHEVEALAEVPEDVQELAEKGILEAEGGAYFQRARPRRRREEAGPQEAVSPSASVVKP